MGEELPTKEQALGALKDALDSGTLTRGDVDSVLGEWGGQKKRINLQQTLYIVGGLIFIFGIVLFVGQLWPDITKPMRVIVTLGLSAVLYGGGYAIWQKKRARAFSRVLFILFALLLPMGLATFFDLIGLDDDGALLGTLISGLSLIPFVASWRAFKEIIFFYFSLSTASALFMFATEWLVDVQSSAQDDWVVWRLFMVGIAWIAVSIWARREKIANTMIVAVGFLVTLGSLFYFLTEYGIFWHMLYPFILAAVYWAAIYLQERSVILWGAIYTIAYVSYITGEYFKDALGWPLAIAVAGLLIMGIGYSSYELSKKLRSRSA